MGCETGGCQRFCVNGNRKEVTNLVGVSNKRKVTRRKTSGDMNELVGRYSS